MSELVTSWSLGKIENAVKDGTITDQQLRDIRDVNRNAQDQNGRLKFELARAELEKRRKNSQKKRS